MAWIESHQQLARHPKLIRLAGVLRIHKAQAIGHLHLLWWWTLDYAPNGDVSVFTSYELAAAAEWAGKPEGFHEALKATGWIDDDNRIHDWHDYAGKLVEERARERERLRRFRAEQKAKNEERTPYEMRTNDGRTGLPNPTQPNPTEESERAPAEAAEAEIPAVSEIQAYGVGAGVPPDYCAHYHERRSVTHSWVTRQGRLIDWRRDIVGSQWWGKDRATWNTRNGTDRKYSKPNPRVAGTRNEGTAAQYRGVGRLVPPSTESKP